MEGVTTEALQRLHVSDVPSQGFIFVLSQVITVITYNHEIYF